MTVAELKALVDSIPKHLEGLSVELPDGLTISIIADEYVAKAGGRFFTTVATLDLSQGTLEELPHVEQDYSKLFQPDGSRNPAAFESDGRIKKDATVKEKGGKGDVELGEIIPGRGR